MEGDPNGEPLGKSIVRSVRVGNEVAVSLLDLEAAAARCERVYDNPEMRWDAWRTMLEGLRNGMLRMEVMGEIPPQPPFDRERD